jgi:hypothetical protein
MRVRLGLGGIAVTGLLIAALTATPAMAWYDEGTTGVTGQFFIPDPSGTGGAFCRYDLNSNSLGSIRIKGPAIYARDRDLQRNSQQVGWSYTIQRRTDVNWLDHYNSTWVKKTAYDDEPAPFAYRVYTLSQPSGQYRVIVRIRWYKPSDAAVSEGTRVVRLKYYRSYWPTGNDHRIDTDYCIQEY